MPRASKGLEEHAMEIRETIAEMWIPGLLGGGKTVRNAAPRDSVGGGTPSRFSFAEVFTYTNPHSIEHFNYKNVVMLLQNCWMFCAIQHEVVQKLQQHDCRDVAVILLQILCCMSCKNVYAYFALDFKAFRASKNSEMYTTHGAIIYKDNFLFASRTFGYKSRDAHTFFAHSLSSSSGQQQP
ncbi:hypothetical protein G5I_04718 [Acromyrmex echinatior]|uniref:Uncharacterized protein n=1 Tax=Acromyrmex echinatior TaxID=103372 RepID=F4WGE4_ACREC|nr:hypothetical protein G5I_04718 [Acromyrmex echinatior]